MTESDKKAFEIVKKLFKNDNGQPFEMTLGQIKLFRAIYEKQNPRIQVECYTQYGKSDVVSMAVLLRATTFPEKWVILGGTKDKAGIIMSKIIKHIFENDYTLGKFQIGKDESLERIKRERSKERITFRVDDEGNLGEVFILSADARRKGEDAGDILIGHGSPNLIEDDAALIPDLIHGKAMRMLGGHKENFLIKVTNTFGRNHAFKSSYDSAYKKIFVDYQQGISEERITEAYISEMRGLLDPIMFGILYNCQYPPADMVDEQGWMSLLTEEDIVAAEQRSVQSIGAKRLGCDISEGINYNAFVVRTTNVARVLKKTLEKNLMKTAEEIVRIRVDENIEPENIFADAIGVGAGVVSRLNELKIFVNGVKAGEKPTETKGLLEFYNLRAQLYWNLKQWILQGGALEPHKDWMQIAKVRYKEDVGRRIKIMPKEEMRMKGLISATESPDIADALALTFAPNRVINYDIKASSPVLPFYPELGI